MLEEQTKVELCSTPESRAVKRALDAAQEQTTIDAPEMAQPEPAKPQRIALFADLIEPNPFQPRKTISEVEIADLANSIEDHTLLQGIIVRLSPENPAIYQIADGERRWRAVSRLIDQGRLPRDYMVECTLRDYTDRQMLEIAMIANMKRKQLNALDEAWGYAELEKMGMTQNEMAKKFESSQPAISNKMRLLKLPESVKDAMRADNLSTGHGIALLALESSAEQGQWALDTLENSLSVKSLEAKIRAYKDELSEREQLQLPPEFLPAEVEAAPAPVDVHIEDENSTLPPVQSRSVTLTDEEYEAATGVKTEDESDIIAEAVEEEAREKDHEELEERTLSVATPIEPAAPAPPEVTGPPVVAMVPASEAAWLKSKGLVTGVALAHFRRFYGICEANPKLAKSLEIGGLGDIMDALEAIFPGEIN